jgi:Prealbumin-like fold domain
LTAGTGGSTEVHDVTAFALSATASSTLRVTKHLIPSYDPGRFNLQIDGVTQAANIGDTGTTGPITVSAGDHTISETAGANTILDANHYTTQISCSNGATGHGTSLTVHVKQGSNLTCTITNTRKLQRT